MLSVLLYSYISLDKRFDGLIFKFRGVIEKEIAIVFCFFIDVIPVAISDVMANNHYSQVYFTPNLSCISNETTYFPAQNSSEMNNVNSSLLYASNLPFSSSAIDA